MTNSKKIRMALAYVEKSEAWLAREIGTSPQNFGKRMKTDKFTGDELEKIANALGAKYICTFEFQDGTKI